MRAFYIFGGVNYEKVPLLQFLDYEHTATLITFLRPPPAIHPCRDILLLQQKARICEQRLVCMKQRSLKVWPASHNCHPHRQAGYAKSEAFYDVKPSQVDLACSNQMTFV